MFALPKDQSDMLYATSNHIHHSEVWLLSGVSSAHVCFACCMEQLEDPSMLLVRKLNIVTELFSVLLNNDTIWDLLIDQTKVLENVIETLLRILLKVKEANFQEIIIEMVILICGKVPSSRLIEVSIDRMTSLDVCYSASYMRLLAQLCDFGREVVLYLADKISSCLELFLKSKLKTPIDSKDRKSFFMLASKLFQVEVGLPASYIKTMIVLVIDSIHNETCVETLQFAVETLYLMSAGEKYRRVLFDHEFSKFTPLTHSIVEALKKILFSKEEFIQLKAISIIKVIAHPKHQDASKQTVNVSINKMLLDKGINEFLLELLISSDETLAVEILSCLAVLMSSHTYVKKGHSVFSLTPVLQTIKRLFALENKEFLIAAMTLLNVILSMDSRPLPYQTCLYVMEALLQSVRCNNADIICQVTQCFTYFVKRVGSFNMGLYPQSLEFIFALCEFLEKELVSVDFGKNVFESVSCFISALKCVVPSLTSKGNSQKSENNPEVDHTMLYFLIDRYLISQAVLKLLPCKNVDFQRTFFNFLLGTVNLVPEKGHQVARKLAESGFIKFIYEFKVKASRLSLNVNELLAQLLVELCLSLEVHSMRASLSRVLSSGFTKLNLPIEDWKYLLTSLLQRSKQNEQVTESRLSVLALLAYSLKCGSNIISDNNLRTCLQNISSQSSIFALLCANGKRYFLYLWVHLDCETAKVNDTKLDLTSSLTLTNSEHQLMKSDKMVAWILNANIETAICVNYLKTYIEFEERNKLMNDNSTKLDVEKFANLTCVIVEYGVLKKFIETLISILIVVETSQTASNIIFLIDFCTAYLDESALNDAVTFLHRLYLMESYVKPDNLMFLYKAFNLFQIAKSYNIDECDLKMFTRGCSLIENMPTPSLALEVINSLNLVVHKCRIKQNAVPLTILIENDNIMKGLGKQVFMNKNLMQNVKTNSTSEQLSASIIILLSEIIEGVNVFGLKFPEKLSFDVDILINILAESQLTILLTSSLVLWTSIMKSNLPTQLFESDDNVSSFSIEKKRLLMICLQNLCCHDDQSIKNKAVACLDELAVSEKFSNSWCKKIKVLSVQHLFTEGYDVFQMRMLDIVIHELTYEEEFVDLLMKFLVMFTDDVTKDITEDAIIFCRFFEKFVIRNLSKLSYENLIKFKSNLHKLETKTVTLKRAAAEPGNCRLQVLYFNNIVFIEQPKSLQQQLENLSEIVRTVRQILVDRITFLDEGETDSEGGFN